MQGRCQERNQEVAVIFLMFVRTGGARALFSVTESGAGRCNRGRSEQAAVTAYHFPIRCAHGSCVNSSRFVACIA
jgi:hypothetical protein